MHATGKFSIKEMILRSERDLMREPMMDQWAIRHTRQNECGVALERLRVQPRFWQSMRYCPPRGSARSQDSAGRKKPNCLGK